MTVIDRRAVDLAAVRVIDNRSGLRHGINGVEYQILVRLSVHDFFDRESRLEVHRQTRIIDRAGIVAADRPADEVVAFGRRRGSCYDDVRMVSVVRFVEQVEGIFVTVVSVKITYTRLIADVVGPDVLPVQTQSDIVVDTVSEVVKFFADLVAVAVIEDLKPVCIAVRAIRLFELPVKVDDSGVADILRIVSRTFADAIHAAFPFVGESVIVSVV